VAGFDPALGNHAKAITQFLGPGEAGLLKSLKHNQDILPYQGVLSG